MTTLVRFATRCRPLVLSALVAGLVLGVAACTADDPKSLIASGEASLAKRDARTAVVQFKSALQRDPTLTHARVLLGRAMLEAGDPVGAALELSKALDAKAPADTVLPFLARAMLLNGDYLKLTDSYDKVQLADKPAQAALKSALAAAWGAQGRREQTERAIAEALAADANFGPARVLNARLTAGRRDFDGALAALDQVLADSPDMAEAWVLKGDILAVGKSDAVASTAAYERALVADGTHLPAHVALITQRIRERDTAAAKVQADKMRAALPNHPMSRFVDAQLAFLDKDLSKAREMTLQLLKGAPEHPGVLLLAGVVEAQSGSLFAAETHLSKLLTINPESLAARNSLAMIYMRLGQHSKASAVLKPTLVAGTAGTLGLALAGDAALRAGNADQAERYYLQASKLEPNDARLRTALALGHLRRGDAATAFAELGQVAASSPDTFADLAIVSARLRRGEFDAALAAVQALEKKAPGQATTAELRGRVLFQKGDLDGARAAYEEALRMDPRMFAATSSLATMDLLAGRREQATARLKAAADGDARNHLALLALAELRARNGGDIEEVRQLFAKAVQAAPQEAAPRLALVRWLLGKRLYKDALVAAQEASAALPSDLSVQDAVGRAQMEAGDVEQAITTFRKLAGGDGNPAAAYVRLADVLRTTGKRSQAEAALRKAIELDPSLLPAHASLTAMLIASGRPREALEHTLKVQRDSPSNPVGYAAEASFHLATKSPDAAIEAYRKGVAATKDPQLARWLHGLLNKQGKRVDADRFAATWMAQHPLDTGFEYHRATVLIDRGDLARAEGLLRQIVARFPENSAALNNLAWVLASRRHPDAIEFAKRALQRAPDSPAVLDTLALAYSANDEHAKALATQQRAVDLMPEQGEFRFQLARLAIKAGDKALARTELERLKAMGPKIAGQAEIEQLLKTL